MPYCEGLEIDLKLAANGRSQAIKELAEALAVKIILHVAWIKMVGDVEDRSARPHLVFLKAWNAKALCDLCIKRDKGGESSRLIARSDEIELFVDDGERKP